MLLEFLPVQKVIAHKWKKRLVLKATEKFTDYILGKNFIMETDHKPLVSLLRNKHLLSGCFVFKCSYHDPPV